MKIQCACGAKYAFDVTPEMVKAPVRLVCQSCGVDNSATVNQLIQQQFGAPAPVAIIDEPAAARLAPAPEIAPPPSSARVVPQVPGVPAPVPASGSGAAPIPPPSPRAPSLRVAAHAAPASTPAPAAVPVASAPPPAAPPMAPRYPMPRREHVNLSSDRLIGRALLIGFIVFFVGIAVWGWYAWVGSVPKVYASTRFAQPGYSGQLHVLPGDQVVFLHGGRLVRYDFKDNKEVWSHMLIDEAKIQRESKAEHDSILAEREKVIKEGGEWRTEIPTLEEMIDANRRAAAAAVHLHARGESIWVSTPGKLTRRDWSSGGSASEIDLPASDVQLLANGDELLLRAGPHTAMVVNLLSGEAKTHRAAVAAVEDTSKPTVRPAAAARGAPTNSGARPTSGRRAGTIERLTSPALNAASNNQQRLEAELRRNTSGAVGTAPARNSGATSRSGAPEHVELVLTRHGIFQISSKSVGVRSINGDNVSAQQSRIRRIDNGSEAEWTGEFPGMVEVRALPGITLVTAGRTVVALDKDLKKVWDKRLEGDPALSVRDVFTPDVGPRGLGPFVEHQGVLYILDNSAVNAVDLASGASKWRLQCEGPSGIVIDDAGDLYATVVVSVGEKADVGVQKIEGATGKPLWKIDREGHASYASGKFLYTFDAYMGDQGDDDDPNFEKSIFYVGPFVRVRRVDSGTGKILWNHVQERHPLDVRIDQNTFQLLFRKEVQLLKYIAL